MARKTEIRRINDLVLSKMVLPSCDDSAKVPEPPGERMTKAFDGRLVRAQCGLIIVEILSDASVKQFIAQVCNGVDDASCGNQMLQTFLARLRERYGFADWNDVSNKCTAHPIDCKTWANVEYWAIASHNDAVMKWGEDQMQRANEQYQVQFEQAYLEELEHRRRVGAALQGFADGMAAASAPTPTVNCTSNTYGTSTTTTCH